MSSADGRRREIIFTILSLQNADSGADHIFEKQRFDLLSWGGVVGRWDSGWGWCRRARKSGREHFIYLPPTLETSPGRTQCQGHTMMGRDHAAARSEEKHSDVLRRRVRRAGS